MSATGLGIDAGGTRTRWALATHSGEIVAGGEAAGMGALHMASEAGRRKVREILAGIAREALATGRPARVQAGITGLGAGEEAMRALFAEAFALEPAAVTLASDIVFAYRGLFEPGMGYVVYAGTGSVAAYIDESGTLHRAGGRGVVLDDGGGGFWIAREALRHVWRVEDERPGAWRDSPMARELFERLGGADWANTRARVYAADRGELGKLALAVAATAASDPVALGILRAAGAELARLAIALEGRFGPRPVAVTGRASRLHPAIADAMRSALPGPTRLEFRDSDAHHAAARLAAAARTP